MLICTVLCCAFLGLQASEDDFFVRKQDGKWKRALKRQARQNGWPGKIVIYLELSTQLFQAAFSSLHQFCYIVVICKRKETQFAGGVCDSENWYRTCHWSPISPLGCEWFLLPNHLQFMLCSHMKGWVTIDSTRLWLALFSDKAQSELMLSLRMWGVRIWRFPAKTKAFYGSSSISTGENFKR